MSKRQHLHLLSFDGVLFQPELPQMREVQLLQIFTSSIFAQNYLFVNFFTKECSKPKGKQWHVNYRGSDVDEPIGKEWSDPQKYHVV
jgi:hypothetical protein